MLDLVTFLEQLKDPRNIRRMETTAIYPGRYEWMKMMTQMRDPRSREELIFCHMFFGRFASMEIVFDNLGLCLQLS